MNIAIYTSGLAITGEDPVGLSLGGSETAVVSMARALARLDHRVTVFCNTGGDREVAGVRYLPAGELPSHPGPGWDVFLSARFHAVLAGGAPARIAVMWHHDPPCEEVVESVRRALPAAAFSFFLSRFQLGEYERWLPGISGSAVLTTNGVDFSAAETIAREPGALRFVYASRPPCGLELLLREIWPRLRERYPQAELRVTSYDMSSLPDRERLARAARERERHDELIRSRPGVRRIGPLTRRELWREMARATAVLYPASVPEVSCMVALETQALGVPIVTTAGYALRETVRFQETLVPGAWGSAEYVEGFVERTARLVEEPAFHRRARQAGRRHVTPRTHSWDALARGWCERFRERLERKAG